VTGIIKKSCLPDITESFQLTKEPYNSRNKARLGNHPRDYGFSGKNLEVKKKKILEAACTSELYATDEGAQAGKRR